MVSLLAFDVTSESDRAVYQSRIAYLRDSNPELFVRLGMSANEKRRTMQKLGLTKPPGASYSDMPMIRLETGTWDPYVRLVGQKLMLALHYQCFGTPLSRVGGLWLYWQTNASHRAIINKDILDIANRLVQPIRETRSLGDQFSVRWNSLDEPRSGLFVVHIQRALVFGGITTEQPEILESELNSEMLHPFSN